MSNSRNQFRDIVGLAKSVESIPTPVASNQVSALRRDKAIAEATLSLRAAIEFNQLVLPEITGEASAEKETTKPLLIYSSPYPTCSMDDLIDALKRQIPSWIDVVVLPCRQGTSGHGANGIAVIVWPDSQSVSRISISSNDL